MGRRLRFCKNVRFAIRHVNAAIRRLRRARCKARSARARAQITADIQMLRVIRADMRRMHARRCMTGCCE